MAKCRIQNLKPPCGYTLEGVVAVWLLDFEDFRGFRFLGDDLYNNCHVEAILRNGDFVEVAAPETAKYTSGLSNKIYAHVLETFVNELSDTMISNLHLATKRRHVPVFKLASGRYFTFGYETGANLSYASQTADAIGALVTITAASIYPPFEVDASALIGDNNFNIEFKPDFTGAYCIIE